MSPLASPRTAIRDLVVAELDTIATSDPSQQWNTTPEVHRYWVEHDQVTQYPALCVIFTDETFKKDRMQGIVSDGKMKIVGYTRDDQDARAVLDKLIDDVILKLSTSNALGAIVENLMMDSVSTDDGTQLAKPFAQFVMVWTFQFQRRFGFAG